MQIPKETTIYSKKNEILIYKEIVPLCTRNTCHKHDLRAFKGSFINYVDRILCGQFAYP